MSPLWETRTSKQVKELEAENLELKAQVKQLQDKLIAKPTEIDKMFQALTKLIAGPEAAAAVAILMALGKIVKQAQAGQDPDFSDVAAAVERTLPADIRQRITEDELVDLAHTGFKFAKALAAVIK